MSPRYCIIMMMTISLTLAAMAKSPADHRIKFTELRSANSPLVTFRIILRAGSINDPKGKEGLNSLTASLIADGGTKDLTYSQVVDKLYPWAARIDVNPDQELTTFTGEVHRDNLDKFYKLLSDLLLHPRFDESDFRRIKDAHLNYIENTLRSTSDESLGKEALNAFMFQNHPYGNPDIGTVQGITSITLDDVKKYYADMYTQARIWIGIAGGYPASLIAKMNKDFGKLPAGEFTEVPLPTPTDIHGMEVMVVEKPARAYAVSMGYPIPVTRKDKDYYALLLANSYLGEHRTFSGILMNHLRGDRGLNYGDYSYIEKFTGGLGGAPFPEPNTPLRQQFFSIWLRPVQPENTHFAIRDALFELKTLVDKGLSKESFDATRNFLLNYSKLWVSTLDRRLGYVMDSEFYGTDYYIDRIAKELNALTVEGVNAAIKKYLHPSDIKIAVVVDEGKAKAFYDSLVTNAPSPIQYEAQKPANILDQDKIIGVFPLDINKEKSVVVKSKELFEK